VLKKCLISVRYAKTPTVGVATVTEDIADAVEAGEPIASLHTRRDVGPAFLTRANRRIAMSFENLAWFKALMTD
jgi:hypothetical protein